MMGDDAVAAWDADQALAWEGMLGLGRRLRRRAEDMLVQDHDVSVSMLGMMGRLRGADRRTLRQSALADAMGLSVSNWFRGDPPPRRAWPRYAGPVPERRAGDERHADRRGDPDHGVGPARPVRHGVGRIRRPALCRGVRHPGAGLRAAPGRRLGVRASRPPGATPWPAPGSSPPAPAAGRWWHTRPRRSSRPRPVSSAAGSRAAMAVANQRLGARRTSPVGAARHRRGRHGPHLPTRPA